MLLGEALQTIDQQRDPLDLLSDDFDLVTLGRAAAAAEAQGESLSQYLQTAVGAFLANASEEDWAQLVGKLQDGQCATGTCLNLMLRRHLSRAEGHGCTC